MERTLTQTHPGVWRLIANNVNLTTGPGTNTYLVGNEEEIVIIDPGPEDVYHQESIMAAVGTLRTKVRAIILTHRHSDHSGGGRDLAYNLKVPLLSFRDPLRPEEKIELKGLTLQIKHTPGHIHDHLCVWLPTQKILFAGDLVAGLGTILVIPPDGNMAAYLDSLQAMKALNPVAILPGHGPIIENPQTHLQEYIDHRLKREQQILDCLAQGYRSAAEIAAQIYADRPEVIGIAVLQTKAHLEKLHEEGRIRK